MMSTLATEPTQRLNVDLPKSQYFALKSYALHNDTTVSQLVRSKLQDVMEHEDWFLARAKASLEALNSGADRVMSETEWATKRDAMKAKIASLKNNARQTELQAQMPA